MFKSSSIKKLSLAAILCLIPHTVAADEFRITHAQVIKTNASLGPYAKTRISDVSLNQLPPEASERLLKSSWVNGFSLEEYVKAVKDNNEEKLREVHQARPIDVPIPTGGGNTQLSFVLSDGTRVQFSNLWDWKLSGYLQDEFWNLFWDKATTTELPGSHDDFPLVSPPEPGK